MGRTRSQLGISTLFSLEHLWEEFGALDVDDRLTRFETPIVFILGRHDWQVPSVLAARYFERIPAPGKRLVWFEQSAHNPSFEEPELFNRTIVDALKPLTGSEQVSEHASSRR
jgi:proline iminopeptidase